MENTEKETSNLPVLQLSPFEAKKEELVKLASDYKNMVVTKDNLKEANEARLVLYRKRIEIQNIAKANRKTIKEFLKTNNDAIEEELIGTIEPTELDLEAKIKTVKDAIAEEERKEQFRITAHKERLELIRSKIVMATNSTDIEWLKGWDYSEGQTMDLEEFTAEGEQLLSTLKETAKNRLELLEFQEAKRKQEEDEKLKAEQALQDVQVAELAAMEDIGLAEMAFDADFEEQEKAAQNGFDMVEPTVLPQPKVEVLKTIEISPSVQNEEQTDKIKMFLVSEQLTEKANEIKQIEFSSTTAKSHIHLIFDMLNRLAAQTIKVADKL